MPTEHPLVRTYHKRNPAVAAGSDAELCSVVADEAGTITAVEYFPDATITGAATNNRTLSVENKTAGVQPAVLNFANAVNATQFASKVIPLSGTPANLVVNAGDVLTFKSLHIGTGIADPGGLVRVKITKSA
jgi:hypothetical protein